MHAARLAFAALVAIAPLPAHADTEFVGYLLNVSCLLGNEVEPVEIKVCEEVGAKNGADARQAHQKWLERNARVVGEMQKACTERLDRAYAGDRAAIRKVRQEAAARAARRNLEAAKEPGSKARQCNAFIQHLRQPDGKADLNANIVRAIRETPASPVQWSKWPGNK